MKGREKPVQSHDYRVNSQAQGDADKQVCIYKVGGNEVGKLEASSRHGAQKSTGVELLQ